MRKSKILMVMTAFVLAVVGVLVAVTSVLSAQQQSVTSSLQVSYQANNVKAQVKVECAKVTTAGAIGSYAAAEGGAITSFDVTASSTTGSVTAPDQTLGFGTTNTDSDTFYRGLIYRFTFTNQYAPNTGCPLKVSALYTANDYALDNVLCAWGVGTTSGTVTMPSDGASATWTPSSTLAGTTAHTFDWLNSTQTIADSVAVNNGSVCLNLFVVIKDTTKAASFKINSASSGNTLLFTLTGVTAA